MGSIMQKIIDWLLFILRWLNENRPEFAWGVEVGIDENYTDPIMTLYRAKFYGLRMRGGNKWGIGFTKCAEPIKPDEYELKPEHKDD